MAVITPSDSESRFTGLSVSSNTTSTNVSPRPSYSYPIAESSAASLNTSTLHYSIAVRAAASVSDFLLQLSTIALAAEQRNRAHARTGSASNDADGSSAASGVNNKQADAIIALLKQQGLLQHQYSALMHRRHELMYALRSGSTASAIPSTAPRPSSQWLATKSNVNHPATQQSAATRQQLAALHTDIDRVSSELAESFRSVKLQLDDARPTMIANYSKFASEYNELQTLFTTLRAELLSSQTFTALQQWVSAAAKRIAEPATLSRTAESLSQQIEKLKKCMQVDAAAYANVEAEKRRAIDAVAAQLRREALEAAESDAAAHAAAKAREEVRVNLRMKENVELKRKIERLRTSLNVDSAVHIATNKYLTEHSTKLSATQREWEEKYAIDVEQKEREYKELRAQRSVTAEELAVYQKRYGAHREATVAAVEEHKERVFEDKRSKAEAEAQKIAANRIRFAWRVYWRKRGVEVKLKKKRLALQRKRKAAAAKKASGK